MARGEGRRDRTSGTFGSVDRLATGYRARYYGPDGRWDKAPTLFQTKAAARAWLSLRHSEIVRDAWMPPEAQRAMRQADLRRLRAGVAGPPRPQGPDQRALPQAAGRPPAPGLRHDGAYGHRRRPRQGVARRLREGDPDASQPCLRASEKHLWQRGGRREGPCQSVRPGGPGRRSVPTRFVPPRCLSWRRSPRRCPSGIGR